jgi:hypothetical protein
LPPDFWNGGDLDHGLANSLPVFVMGVMLYGTTMFVMSPYTATWQRRVASSRWAA